MNTDRIKFIDYARSSLFLLMIIDHALHAYALRWGHFWFFRDMDRESVFDLLYLFNQSIIMPGLFFITGLFVTKSLDSRGALSFVKEKLIRLGIPFFICIPVTVPLLSYPRHITYDSDYIGYWQYVTEVFWQDRLQAGPLWVMQAMFFYGLLTAVLIRMPIISKGLQQLFQWMLKQPRKGGAVFICIAFILLTLCDFLWGAPWWIKPFNWMQIEECHLWNKFLQLFALQGSRSMMLLWYTLSGAIVMQLRIPLDQNLTHRLASHKLSLAIGTAVAGVCYSAFSMENFYNGAYYQNADIMWRTFTTAHHFWELLENNALMIVRNFLLAVLTFTQLLLLFACSISLAKKPQPFLAKFSALAYAMFLTHETFVVWMQYLLNNVPIPVYGKFIITLVTAFSASWIVSSALIKIPLVKRVLSPDYRQTRRD